MLDEKQRLLRLHQLQVLDSEPDLGFDGLVRQALAMLPGTSIAAVSLVDKQRQWFKAIVGLDAKQTPRSVSFCSHTIQSDDPMVVEDATLDSRFADNILVTSKPSIRFYAGIPLVDGVGALCVISSTPRKTTTGELAKLQSLAVYVNIQLMLHATVMNCRRYTPSKGSHAAVAR